jgi:Tfp pilus assembly major pilin PilA
MGAIVLPVPWGRQRVSHGLDESGEPSMISKQRGMTLIGFLIVLAGALFVAYIAMKLVPIYLNHYSVVSSMKSLAAEPDAANMSEARLRDLLSRKFSTSYVKHVTARDIEIVRSTGVEVVAEYEVREDLIGNLDAVVTFKRVQPLN